MKPWLVPAATVVLLGAATVAAALAPAAAPPPAAHPSDTGRITLACPSFDTATAFTRVAAAATGAGLRTAALSDPGTADEPQGVAVLAGRKEPVLVSGRRDTTFGAVSMVRADTGPDRGLSGVTCRTPGTQQWFTGVQLGDDAQADLVLVNSDSTDAVVDLTILGPQGRINAPGSRGLVVEARGARSVPLAVLASADGPVSVLVESSAGRVAPTLRQRLWDGSDPLGADWIPATAAPDTELVIPGIPAGDGRRELVVTNPGERTASVAVELLGEQGRSALAGVEHLEIPAGTTRTFDLGPGLAGQVAGLRLAAEQRVTATVRLASAAKADQSDPAWAAALPGFGPDGLWPIPASTSAKVALLLSNPAEEDQTVEVTLGNQLGGPGETTTHTVPAGATLTVAVPEAETDVVEVRAGEASPVRGAVVVTSRLGKIRGLALIDLVDAQQSAATDLPIEYDPHAGA